MVDSKLCPKMGTGLTAMAVRPISFYFYYSWLSEIVGQLRCYLIEL